jgi:two-component system sensor histidine kinase KdpD
MAQLQIDEHPGHARGLASLSSRLFAALSHGFGLLAGLDFANVRPNDQGSKRRGRFAFTLVACAATTAVAVALRGRLPPFNLVMLYLLVVVLLTVRFGRATGIAASMISVLAFDVFLVPPYNSLSVADPRYLLTFAIMLLVSLIISHLTASLRRQVLLAYARERRTQALFNLSKDLSGALTRESISEIGIRHVQSLFVADAFLLFSSNEGRLGGALDQAPPPLEMQSAAQRVFDCLAGGKAASGGLTLAKVNYLPLCAPAGTRGVLIVAPRERGMALGREQEQLLQTVAAQIALAAERVHYVEVAQATTMAVESERLRNSLLSAISHDVRTPLTAIVGMASTLAENRALPAQTQEELAAAIYGNAFRMRDLVSNLLDMARLNTGCVALNREWHMLEEVIGGALAYFSLGDALVHLSPQQLKCRVTVAVPPDLPLLEFDAVLIERVLCNLLDNARKYAAGGRAIHICARHLGDAVQIAVEDRGPGVPAGMEELIFEKFTRARPQHARPGTGLGLAICRTVVEAHRGRIWAENRQGGGARFVFSLPAGTPPAVEELAG